MAEEKIRTVLEGLRGEESIAALCLREGLAESLYYAWSREFLGSADCAEWEVPPGRRRRPRRHLRRGEDAARRGPHTDRGKEVVAEQALELWLLKKCMLADGDDGA
jgi:transposase